VRATSALNLPDSTGVSRLSAIQPDSTGLPPFQATRPKSYLTFLLPLLWMKSLLLLLIPSCSIHFVADQINAKKPVFSVGGQSSLSKVVHAALRLWRVRRHLYWDRGLGSALCHNIACGGTRSVFRSFRYIANLQMRGYPDHFPSLNGIMRRWSKAIATHTSPPHTNSYPIAFGKGGLHALGILDFPQTKGERISP